MKNFKIIKILLYRPIPLVIGFLLFNSCNGRTFDSKSEMLSYLQDENNGYTQHRVINGIKFSFSYRPTDLMVIQEIDKEGINRIELQRLRDKYNKYMYFNLSISKNNRELLSSIPKNKSEFNSMVNLLVFEMDNKVNLYNDKKDTLKIVDFIYPRMYGLTKSTSLMFIFSKDSEKLDAKVLNFSIENLVLNTGEVKFKFPVSNIVNQPHLSFFEF